MALDREANNGGYDQFFVNSSRKYASTIVGALERTGCHATAALTQRAIEESNLKPDPESDRALHALDQQFYKIFEIEAKLFAFVASRRQAFVLEKMSVAPRPPQRGKRHLIMLGVGLDFAPQPERTFEAVRKLVAEIAIQRESSPPIQNWTALLTCTCSSHF
jgi:hypothetical protein